MASTDLVAGDATNNATYTGGNDGTMKLRVGPNGAKVDALTFTSGGVASFPQGFTGGGMLTLGTSQATTTGTSKDFTGIPSWVKRITVMLNGVSTAGAASGAIIQLGTSGGIVATGYTSVCVSAAATNTVSSFASTSGFAVHSGTVGENFIGTYTFFLISANNWVGTIAGNRSGNGWSGGGNVTLSGTLDRIRLTTVNGTDTFDAGSVNILFEG